MKKTKNRSDTERFSRYQSVVDILFAKDGFSKAEIYTLLKDEDRNFIGRIINELVREGYLAEDGVKSIPVYSWTDKREKFESGRWIDQKVFTATVKRSPSEDRPRERLLRLGPSEMKTSELLAILIRSGLHGESAMQAGEKLAARFGNDLHTLSLKARGELKQISKAIGETAYCQIIAALELGKRLAKQEKSGSEPVLKITSTTDALSYCRDHFMRLAREASREEFHIVLLNEKHHVIKTEQVTVGLIDKSLAHPREVFRAAIAESAAGIVVVHNQPSGNPSPSADDRVVTRQLVEAGRILDLPVCDHLIVGGDKYFSFAEAGLL